MAAAFVLFTWWAAQMACSGGYVSPAQLTATAGPVEIVAGLNLPQDQPTLLPTLPQVVPTAQVTAESRMVDPSPIIETPVQENQPIEPVNTPEPTVSPTPKESPTPAPPILYYTQAGDTLKGLAARYNVLTAEITSPEGAAIPAESLFDPGVLLLIPQRLGDVSNPKPLIPDSEVVYSPSSLDFNMSAFIKDAGGYMSVYREWRYNGWYDGAGIIQRVSVENSINPRLLMLILEQQSHWVYGQPASLAQTDFPIGYLDHETDRKGLYFQLSWAVEQLNKGYYGWRDGSVTELTFPDGTKLRLAPELNAGTVSLLYLFSRLYHQQEWAGVLYGPEGIMDRYEKMFGSPWLRAQSVEPLFPATLEQPPLALPFLPGHTWSFTGGPHSAWGKDQEQPRAALDFAPSATVHGCYKSTEWTTASAAGLVVRSGDGLVVLDLDGDGYEQTGWVLLYMHVAAEGRVAQGAWVNQDDPIGHPSCEGGISTGTHIHMARKYNGEWIMADGAMPFNLSGWRTHAEREAYMGSLTLGDQTVSSSLVGSYESRITRPLESASPSR
jgi:LysM repeat protein